jgi:hypothetical protein
MNCCGSERIRKFLLDPNPNTNMDSDSNSDPDNTFILIVQHDRLLSQHFFVTLFTRNVHR